MFDYRLLRGRIRAEGMTDAEAAKAVGLAPSGLSARLNGAQAFRQSEIWKICEVFKIKPKEIVAYFFTPKVQEPEPTRASNAKA